VEARRFCRAGLPFSARQRCRLAQGACLAEICEVKKLFLLSCLVFTCCGAALAEANWLTDYEAAKAKAKSDNKLVLLEFTGSDWCGYCKRMQAEIFSKPQFQDYAAKNLILVELDFPRPGGEVAKAQSNTVRRQNMQLASEYNIEGFPTTVVLNPDGKRVANFFGYIEGGPEQLIAALEKLRKS
jgi:protein disulfide-isomerase